MSPAAVVPLEGFISTCKRAPQTKHRKRNPTYWFAVCGWEPSHCVLLPSQQSRISLPAVPQNWDPCGFRKAQSLIKDSLDGISPTWRLIGFPCHRILDLIRGSDSLDRVGCAQGPAQREAMHPRGLALSATVSRTLHFMTVIETFAVKRRPICKSAF